ncbi:unnamed protein product [Owenia fusiformis]|uniref:Uncharacterized protein n=1 Tax=Owenia fusiformis TaxID=6347 RepID=A0A8J1XQV1_OWEFU|nr:unnamed protein product [Owenia fusiformis]
MSASVDQRGKGQPNQVSNPPNDKGPVKETEFDAYMQHSQQPQQGYGSVPMSSPSTEYMNYAYPSFYLNTADHGQGAWSTAGGDPMGSFLSYPQSDYVSNTGVFSSGGFPYSQPGFGWEFPGYTDPWASNANGDRKDSRGSYDYYHPEALGPTESYVTNGDIERVDMSANGLDHGMKVMSLENHEPDTVPEMHGGNVGKDLVGQAPHSAPAPATSSAPKKMSWANIASQPAKPQPSLKPKSIPMAPVLPNSKHSNMDIGTWGNKNNATKQGPAGSQNRQAWGSKTRGSGAAYNGGSSAMNSSSGVNQNNSNPVVSHPVLDKLKSANSYNPKEYNVNTKGARFFIIKSYSEDDIHRSIKYNIWCSTEHGNKRLEQAYKQQEGKGPVYLLYSVNGSGHFCGMAQMISNLDYNANSGVWAQDKWKGQFEVKWIYVKDVPNSQLRHIRLENNENKPVTNSRDTQEVPFEKGKQVLKIIHTYRHTTSIFDDFGHYEKRQEEEDQDDPRGGPGMSGGSGPAPSSAGRR